MMWTGRHWRATGRICPRPIAASLILTACSATTPAPQPATADNNPARARSVLWDLIGDAYRGLPVRVRLSAAPDTAVSIRTSGGAVLDSARTDRTGHTKVSWTWHRTGPVDARVIADGSSATIHAKVLPRHPATIPASNRGTYSGVIAAGRQNQFLRCAGNGGPTVVLVAGAWGWSKDYRNQFPDLKTVGRVCTYDRPGAGRSPARTGTTNVDAGLHARELRALLRESGELPPFEVVGHSYGGLIAQAFAGAYPHATAGMVLLDPVPVGFSTIWPEYGSNLEEGSPLTTLDLIRSSDAARSAIPTAGLPFIVVTAGLGRPSLSSEGLKAWKQAHADQAAGCTNCLHWTARHAGHQVQELAPRMTLRAIQTVGRAIRQHRPVFDV